MIELGKPSTPLNYDDALMYCFWYDPVGHWRMPTKEEYDDNNISGWYEDRDRLMEKIHQQTPQLIVFPVRTL